ncbi:hypothetical protein FOZ63_016745, partial [Perkinsus olseni]
LKAAEEAAIHIDKAKLARKALATMSYERQVKMMIYRVLIAYLSSCYLGSPRYMMINEPQVRDNGAPSAAIHQTYDLHDLGNNIRIPENGANDDDEFTASPSYASMRPPPFTATRDPRYWYGLATVVTMIECWDHVYRGLQEVKGRPHNQQHQQQQQQLMIISGTTNTNTITT